MAKYIVVRDANAFQGRRLETPVTRTLGTEAFPHDHLMMPQIESADITRKEAQDAERDPAVMAVARSMPIRLIRPKEGDDEDGDPEWGIEAVGAIESDMTGAGQTVAVLDTGIDPDHPAFAGVTLDRRNFTTDGEDDGDGHGTHCAGTIFGRDVDGKRIGVARGVTRALIGKVLDDEGSGSSRMLFNAMQWAFENDARVISMSLGFDFPGLATSLQEDDGLPALLATSIALEEYRRNLRVFDSIMALFASQAAFGLGTVVVAASGNESLRAVHPDFEVSASLPSAANGVLSVGALQQGDDGLGIADFSNTNPVLSAPGVGIVSAQAGGGLRSLNGTSMACPHVAGCALLWWERLSNAGVPLTHRAVEARLQANARQDVFAPGVDVADRGNGLVQSPPSTTAPPSS